MPDGSRVRAKAKKKTARPTKRRFDKSKLPSRHGLMAQGNPVMKTQSNPVMKIQDNPVNKSPSVDS